MAWSYEKAVVIDDALGPPSAGSVSTEDKTAWIRHVMDNQDVQEKLLQTFGRKETDPIGELLEEVTSDTERLQELWRHYEEDRLQVGLDLLFAQEQLGREGNQQKAKLVYDFLVRKIGGDNVGKHFDIASAKASLANADLAFVDFFLVPGETEDQALARIREHAELLKQPDVLIFMSSKATLTLQQRVRDEIGVRSAFFDVMRKQDITEEHLVEKIERHVRGFEANQSLEELITHLADAMRDAANEFEATTKTLETHDLKFLNVTRLEADNEPLPEYLTWLFSEYVAAKARRSSSQKKLPALSMNDITFSGQIRQSQVLFDMYSEVVFAPGRDKELPLRFGEVLQDVVVPENYVLVLTPACDLARCSRDAEVLCLRGISVTVSDAKVRASQRWFGKVNGSTIGHMRAHPDDSGQKTLYSSITWDTKSVFTAKVEQLLGTAFARVQVMNEMFAQEVKEEALRSIGRIGTQIDPPPATALKATARWKNAAGAVTTKHTPNDAFEAALVMHSARPDEKKPYPRQAPLIVLSDAFKQWLGREIRESFGNAEVTDKILLGLRDLTVQPHFQTSDAYKVKGDRFSIQILEESEKLPEAPAQALEITLWAEAEDNEQADPSVAAQKD